MTNPSMEALIERLERGREDEGVLINDVISFASEAGWLHPIREALVHRAFEVHARLCVATHLVPGDWKWTVTRQDGRGYACVWGPHGNRSALAETPALALCIAALKARREPQP